jgi:hypothetical protein
MRESTIDAFFCRLFMDEVVLRESGVEPRTRRTAVVPGYRLYIGPRATMVREFGAQVYGMVFGFTHEELDRLYSGAGLDMYRPEGVLAHVEDGTICAATAHNLGTAPVGSATKSAYAQRLGAVLARLGLPEE